MAHPPITTSVSTVQLLEGDVLDWTYHHGAVVDLTAAEEEVTAIDDYLVQAGVRHVRLRIDIRPIRSISRQARALFSSDGISEKYVIALGLVIKGPVSRMIGNFYLNWHRPPHPTRLFNELEPATAWLASQTRDAEGALAPS